ncbi:MAG: hypothetical protein FWD85_02870 [Microbacteriaceae bacterium]|nr:hypothetical protein [Nocardioidaceae bacterium]MCL2794233.1 hypothetical protein [Microbacteriaceae bacterium]
MSSRSFTKAVVAGVACTVTIAGLGAFGASAALADPTSATNTATASPASYVAVGSDTIQSLYDGFANGYVNGAGTSVPSTASIASWLVTGSTMITPSNTAVPTGANPIARPVGSGAGRAALSAAWNPTNDAFKNGATYAVTPHSIDIARSSGKPNTTTYPGTDLASIPLARDAVAIVINDEPTLDNVILPGTLAALYREPNRTDIAGASNVHEGFYTQSASGPTAGDVRNNGTDAAVDEQVFDGTNWISVHPFLPFASGSGTRQFFQTAIGGTTSDDPGIGVSDVVGGGTVAAAPADQIIENSGAIAADKGDIAPFSAAQWIAQQNGTAPNTITDPNLHIDPIAGLEPVTGTAPHLAPGALFGDTSTVAASGFGIFDRDVYSVVATAELNADSDLKTLVTETLPQSDAVTDFGFEKLQNVATDPNNWIMSGFENTGTAPIQATSTSVSVAGITGTAVTLTATVTGPAGFTIPAGDAVTFKNGATTLGTATTNAAGVATLKYTAPDGALSLNLTAAYAGHATPAPAPFAASTSPALSYSGYIVGVDTAGTVKVSGTAKVGSVLSSTVTGATSGATLSYQWKAGTTVVGTGSKLTVPGSAYAKTITLTVTASKAHELSGSTTSAATAKIAIGTLTAPTPKISGTVKRGYTLTATPGTWTSGTKLAYQWKANGAAIKGATGHTFKLTSAQAGKRITVTVTGSQTGYTTVAKTSAATGAVK